MRNPSEIPYRPCVGIALFNAHGLVFVGRRKQDKVSEYRDLGYEWQMPQGGIDAGEEPYAAAKRELFEETNVQSATLIAEAPEWYHYDLPHDSQGKAFRGRYRGQAQKWFAFRFEGQENEINVLSPAEGRHRPEFVEWRWERLEKLPELIVPFKRDVYEKVVGVFTPHAAR